MVIAFDLDNTLIRNEYQFPIEKPKKTLFAKLLQFEELREGTKEIFDFCKQQNWQTWIYTTSFRNSLYIKQIFWLYDIKLSGVVNQDIHNRNVRVRSSKYPPTFGINVVIDDSEGVKMEGEKYNFNVICIQPNNINWVKELKFELIKLHNISQP